MLAVVLAAMVYLVMTRNKKKEGYSGCGCGA